MFSSRRFLLIGGVIGAVALIGSVMYFISGASTARQERVEKHSSAPAAQSQNTPAQNRNAPAPKNAGQIITLATSMGEIQFRVYDTDAPKTAENFITLAKKGFYDNLTFHRVIKGFMIQGGDPKGDGTGGPGYTFADELNSAAASYQEGYKKGVVAMANAGPNTNGSQFFIMLADTALPHSYTIFGKVIKGQDVVDAIGSVKTDGRDRPIQPVVIRAVKVENVSQ